MGGGGGWDPRARGSEPPLMLLLSVPPFSWVCLLVKFTHSLPLGVPVKGVTGSSSMLDHACVPFSLQGPSSPPYPTWIVGGGSAGQVEGVWGEE